MGLVITAALACCPALALLVLIASDEALRKEGGLAVAVPALGVLIGIGAIFALLASGDDDAEAVESQSPQPDKATTERITDPLPELPLNQSTIVDAITTFAETGEAIKMQACLAKSVAKGTSPALRAYFVATLKAIPEQLKADLDFIKDFTKSEKEVADRIAAETKRNDAIIRVTESTATAVVSAVNAAAGAVVAAALAIFEAARSITLLAVGPLPRREAKDQIYQLIEGPTLRRGVLFQPNLPYITKGERDLSDGVRARWIAQSDASEWFLALPTVAPGASLRFAPRWDDFSAAVQQLQANGQHLEGGAQ